MTGDKPTAYVSEGTSLLSIDSVAERLNCSPRTVMRLADRGELSRVRIGKLVRFRPEQIDALIERSYENDTTPRASGAMSKSWPVESAGHASG
jgi:excisionase family DNA binding protein